VQVLVEPDDHSVGPEVCYQRVYVVTIALAVTDEHVASHDL
jgi:hypothetical protein